MSEGIFLKASFQFPRVIAYDDWLKMPLQSSKKLLRFDDEYTKNLLNDYIFEEEIDKNASVKDFIDHLKKVSKNTQEFFEITWEKKTQTFHVEGYLQSYDAFLLYFEGLVLAFAGAAMCNAIGKAGFASYEVTDVSCNYIFDIKPQKITPYFLDFEDFNDDFDMLWKPEVLEKIKAASK